MPARAAFLDRDGTIIYDRGPARVPADVELIPGVAEKLLDLSRRGYRLIVVTNQAGIGRGDYTTLDFLNVNAQMVKLLKQKNVKITATFWCPHVGYCFCRKPGREMFDRAAREHNLDLKKSFMVGDKPSDVIPGIKSLIVQPNLPQAWVFDEL